MQTTSYLYRPVLNKAWEITRKFKLLWIFGLFSVLVSSGGEYEMISRAFYNSSSDSIFNSIISGLKSGWSEGLKLVAGDFWGNLGQLLMKAPDSFLIAIFVLLFLLVLILFFVWLAISSQIALIKGVSLANKNKKMSIREGFVFANKNFFPVLGVIILLKAVLFVLFFLLGWEYWLTSSLGILGAILYVISFIFFVLIVLVASFILKYQVFYLILRKEGFGQSLKSAWQLFSANWLVSIEMSLIMLGVYLVASALSLLIISICAGIPIIIIPFYLLTVSTIVKVIISALAAIIAVVGVFAVTSIMSVFQWASWTVLFEKLDNGEEVSKISRIGENIKNLPDMMFNK